MDQECESSTGRVSRWHAALLLAALGIGMTACSDGSGGSGAADPPPSTKPDGRGTVVVTATDAIGTPLAGASVLVLTKWAEEDRQAIADSSGRVEIKDVVASELSVQVVGPDSFGLLPSQTLAAGATLAIIVPTLPTADGTGGIARAWVPAGGVSNDGRTLEFALEIVQVPASREYWAYPASAVRVGGCIPVPGQETPGIPPEYCAAAAGGLDASYHASAVSVKKVSRGGPPAPAAAVLLIDQGTSIVVNDPADARLFAAKYFLTLANDDARIGLAAFSSDDPASGRFSLLPQKPVTVFASGGSGFTADGRAYFETVDGLGAREGGASPVYAAIDAALDFAAAGPRPESSAVVVVTNGLDETCGTNDECRAALDAVVRKSKASGVRIVTVGMVDATGAADREALGLLSQGAANGAAYWAPDPRQLTMVLGDVHALLAGTRDTLEAVFRIESPVKGAFASGRTVAGYVSLEVCAWDCASTVIPFVVQVP